MSRVIHRLIVHTRAANHDFDFDLSIFSRLVCGSRKYTGFLDEITIANTMAGMKGGRRQRDEQAAKEKKKCKKLCYDMIKTYWIYNWNFFVFISPTAYFIDLDHLSLTSPLATSLRFACNICTEWCSFPTNLTFVCSWKWWWLLLFKFPNSKHARDRPRER